MLRSKVVAGLICALLASQLFNRGVLERILNRGVLERRARLASANALAPTPISTLTLASTPASTPASISTPNSTLTLASTPAPISTLTLASTPAPISTPIPTPEPIFGNIFHCGYEDAGDIAARLFPERPRHIFAGTSSKADDVIVANGPCGLASGSFSGVMLYVDGESGKIQVAQQAREVYLGPHDPPMVGADRKALFRGQAVVPYISSAALSLGLESIADKLLGGPRTRPRKDLFVAYTHRNCVGFREHAFDTLTRMAADHGWPEPTPCSACYGSLPRVTRNRGVCAGIGSEWATNSKLFGRFRFVIAMENRKWRGYVTEKILNAFVGDSIPIYYGADTIFEIFNRESFVYYDVTAPGAALEKIEYLMHNETAYWEMFDAPILLEGPDTIKKYFSWSDSIQGGYLKRRIRQMVFDAKQMNTI
jgi:hypothetical protein